jgi:polysaccharide export outer membrane protein
MKDTACLRKTMMKNLIIGIGFVRRFIPVLGLAILTLMGVTGCETSQSNSQFEESTTNTDNSSTNLAQSHFEEIILREGDVVKISFPAASGLDTEQQIRRDGKIVMPLTGETKAAGLTPAELEQKVIELYASQLTTKQAVVTVISSSFPVFVTGAVVHPGKILSDHPISALEAIMESGGFDYATANLKAVRVIRAENGHMQTYNLNLKPVMQGKKSEPFYLKPSDIVYVPERFTWF